ncbi:Calx-beta domain-containing protein [Aerosakkonema funiforme]|uniref:Calx-beta domain-containing protein n=1 Tax=Aerosakkonema funiforme TaxID=1246630 RepID=UPI0035B701BE
MELPESSRMFSDDNPLAINQNSYLINMQGDFQPLNQIAGIKNIAFIDSVGTEPQGVTVGDFDRDGLLDIAAANFRSRNVSVLLNSTTLVNFGAATYSGTEGSSDTIVNIPVTLSATPTTDVTVPIAINATSTATESASNDYNLSTTSVVFAAGATGAALTQNIAVTIKPDNIPETDETVILNLGNITGAAAGTTKQTTLTIAANDGINYAVSAGVVSISEGNSASNPLTFTVSRGGGIDAASSVDFAIAGTATNNSDYNNIGGTSGATGTTGTINFAAGETQKTITMNVVGDTAFEPDETVIVSLSNPVAPGQTPTISNSSATTTINNDDTAPQPGTLQFTAANFSVPEGNSGGLVNATAVTVNRTGGSSGAVSVQARVNLNNPGTANPNDYNYNVFPITVNFADGDTAAKTVVIPINGDTTVEPDETVNLELISGSATGGATIGSQNTAILTISNDDVAPFTDINAVLTGVLGSSVAWGDYDNDGKLDILLTGYTGSSPIAKVYRNTGSGFIDINAGLTGVDRSSVAWGDYDNDGKLDILLTGDSNSGRVAKVYRNTGSGFTDINAGLTGVYDGSAAWGDYDNDGKLDILLTGYSNSGFISKVYRNTGSGFTDINAGLTGVEGRSAWGDYDNDGKLDILLTGWTVIDDNQAEGNEIVSLTLIGNSAYNLGNSNSATVTIADNEPAINIPTIGGTQTINATLSPTDPNNPTRSGSYKDDYRLVGVTPGQTIQINLNAYASSFDTYLQVINADTGREITSDDDSGGGRNSQLSLTVQPGINYLVRVTSFYSGDTGNYTLITSNPPSVVTISATDANAAEVVNGQTPNPGQFTISRTGSTTNSLTVNYTTGGTATKGTDYNNLPGNIVIPVGQSSVNLPINVIDDTLREGNETAILTLAANSAYTIGNANSGTVTIADNEPFNNPPQEIIHLHDSFRYPTNGAVTISNVYTDPDGDRLTYTATKSNGEPLPNWLQFSFNSNNNSITFTQVSTPPSNWQSFDVKLTATDSWGASRNQDFLMYKDGSGWAIDGYIAGATIFFDANKNGVRDDNEPSTTTDNSGAYHLDISPDFDTNNNGQFDPEEGKFVAYGGTDTATGLPLETPLSAPSYASVVTLLTSLVAESIDRGMNPNEAESQVKAALSLPSDVNLTSLDPIAATNNKEPGGVEVLAAMVKVQNFITQTKGLIDGALGLPQNTVTAKNEIVQGIVGAIVNQIESGVILDFSNPEQLAVIIEESVSKAQKFSPAFNPAVNAEFIASAANVMAQVNQRIDKIAANTAPESIHQQIARVQKLALGEITLDFKASASGAKSINEVIAENTGAALDTQIQTATIPGVTAVPIINRLPKFDSTLLFDSDFYLQQYKDVADAVANKLFPDALAHFSQFGWAEGRNPSAMFATDYLNKNSDVAAAVGQGFFHSGFEHFVKYGMAENREGTSEYTRLETFYLSQNLDVAEAVRRGSLGSGIEHLVRFGMTEGRNPFTPFNVISETFDPTFYLAKNQDVAEAVSRGVFRNAFEHFVWFGLLESRDPSILFDNTSYLAQNSDVAVAVRSGIFHSGLEHFLKRGMVEGRAVKSALS